jgi:transposase InsO family protein
MTDALLEERRVVAVRALVDMLQRTGELSPEFRCMVAHSIELSDRQVRRDIAAGGRTRHTRRRRALDDEIRAELWECKANVSELARVLGDRYGADAPSRRTLARMIERGISCATIANIKRGERARHEFEVSLPQEYEDIGELYGMDAKKLSILALDDIEVWVINVIDCCSRVIVNFVMSPGSPNAVHARRALRGAFLAEGPVKEFYGLPMAVRYDNALAHLATQIVEDLLGLTVAIDLTDAYHPWHNGIIEAFHHWVEHGLCAQHDFYSRGATALDGRLFVPDAPRPSFEQIADEYAKFVDNYNNERPHSGIGGQVPADAWRAHL